MEQQYKPRFYSVAKVSSLFDWGAGGIRHLILTDKKFNELCVRRVGKKVLIDVVAMEKWISEGGK